jgi:hypothetical protein
VLQKVYKLPPDVIYDVGIMITLSIIFTTAFTDGGFAEWTVGSIISQDLPPVIANITVP